MGTLCFSHHASIADELCIAVEKCFSEQFGSVSVTTDSSGNASITYPRRVNSCAESEFGKIRRQRLPPAPTYHSRRPRSRSPFGSGRLAPRTTHRSSRSRNSGRDGRDRRTTTSAAQNASQPDTAIQIIDVCFSSQPSVRYRNGPDCAMSAPSRGGIHSAWSAKIRLRYLVNDPMRVLLLLSVFVAMALVVLHHPSHAQGCGLWSTMGMATFTKTAELLQRQPNFQC